MLLSGNVPLVEVLRVALALDAIAIAQEAGRRTSKVQEHRRASAFIQNILHFRDEALGRPAPAYEGAHQRRDARGLPYGARSTSRS